MYSYIKGELTEVNLAHIVVEANGSGYMIFVLRNLLTSLPSLHEDIKVYTYLYIREDAMILYGFLTKDDLEMFKLLITVNGIGPKGGLAVLSTLSSDDLRFAILSDDAKAIAKSPGVGAKTAQRVILDLKDKMSLEDAFEKKLEHNATAEAGDKSVISTVKNDAILALTALGYSSTESMKAVSKVEIDDSMDVESVLKSALKFMSIL